MSKGYLGLELGEKKVRYAYLEKKGGEIFLKRTGELPVEEDFSSPLLLTNVIEEILSKENISPSQVFLTLLREDIITHQSTFPKMSSAELEEVILGEIEKVPTFSEREFDYIYHSYEVEPNRINVIFAAVGKDILNFIIEGVKNNKLPLGSIEVSTLNLPPLLYSLVKGNQDQALLILDEKVSYVMIFREKKCRFFYVMNTGKIDLYPYNKKDEVNNLALVNWADELKRTFKSYLIEQKRETIENVWFVYDHRKAANLDKVLSKELSLEVIKLNIELFPNLHYEGEEEFNPIYLLCCAPVISYLKKLKREFPFHHFLRKEKVKIATKRVIVGTLIYVMVVGAILGKVAIDYSLKRKELLNTLRGINTQINLLERKTARLRRERDEFLATKKRLLNQATFVRKLNRTSWSRIFAEVASNLPDTLSLTSFSVSEAGEVRIEGEAFKIETLAELIRKMDNSPILTNVKFDFLREQKVEDKRIFSFGILSYLPKEKRDGKR